MELWNFPRLECTPQIDPEKAKAVPALDSKFERESSPGGIGGYMYTRKDPLEELSELADKYKREHLQLSLLASATNSALDKTVGV